MSGSPPRLPSAWSASKISSTPQTKTPARYLTRPTAAIDALSRLFLMLTVPMSLCTIWFSTPDFCPWPKQSRLCRHCSTSKRSCTSSRNNQKSQSNQRMGRSISKINPKPNSPASWTCTRSSGNMNRRTFPVEWDAEGNVNLSFQPGFLPRPVRYLSGADHHESALCDREEQRNCAGCASSIPEHISRSSIRGISKP